MMVTGYKFHISGIWFKYTLRSFAVSSVDGVTERTLPLSCTHAHAFCSIFGVLTVTELSFLFLRSGPRRFLNLRAPKLAEIFQHGANGTVWGLTGHWLAPLEYRHSSVAQNKFTDPTIRAA